MKQRSFRHVWRLRIGRIWWPRVRRRGLFLVGGVAIGLLAVLMAALADRAQDLFFAVEGRWSWAPLLVTPAGFALSSWLTIRFFPGAQGSGIPQVIAARATPDQALRQRLVALRLALGKIALLTLGLAAGASSGREGPTVQVGAAAMFALARMQPHRQPGLLLAGSAAGVAAAFNAPLAGIMFAIEEMSRSFETRTSGLVLSTVIAAGLTSLAILGDYIYFGISTADLPLGPDWLAIPLAGLACGLAGGLFSRVVIAGTRHLPQVLRHHPVAFAAGCGLAVALCGLLAGNSIFGTGYAQSTAILGEETMPVGFGPLKLVATALSSVSGIPGGIFSPSLAVGAGLGYDLSLLFPALPLQPLVILCMAAYLAGVVQAPLTSFVIVIEMTATQHLVFPIMLASLIGAAISRLICREGIYHALARGFLAAPPSSPGPPGPKAA